MRKEEKDNKERRTWIRETPLNSFSYYHRISQKRKGNVQIQDFLIDESNQIILFSHDARRHI